MVVRMKVDAPRHSWVVALVLGTVVVGSSAPANADEAADRKAEAQRLFTDGQAAFDKGDKTTGCLLMRKSLKLFAVANALFNVAQCDEADGKLASALGHWQRGLSLVDNTDKRVVPVKKSIAALEGRLPKLSVVIAPRFLPLEILVDDEPVEAEVLSAPFFVDVGKRVITIRKAGHKERKVELVVQERERTEVVAEPGEAESANVCPPAPVIPPPPNLNPLKISAYAALGVGAAALIGAATTGGFIVSNDTAINQSCPNKFCATGRPNEIIDSQNTLIPLNGVFWGVGLVGAASGAAMLLIANRLGKENKAPVVAPLILKDGGGLGFTGRF